MFCRIVFNKVHSLIVANSLEVASHRDHHADHLSDQSKCAARLIDEALRINPNVWLWDPANFKQLCPLSRHNHA